MRSIEFLVFLIITNDDKKIMNMTPSNPGLRYLYIQCNNNANIFSNKQYKRKRKKSKKDLTGSSMC